MEGFARTSEPKVMRDCVHGYIHIHLQVVWDCINTREFQRLRRIHQLGGDFMVYHTAEHSRFSHSLGVYEITRRIVEEVPGIGEQLTGREKAALLCAALLHDLGHGPFSHFFESLSHVHHEKMSIRLIMDPSTEIHQVLERHSAGLAREAASILSKTHPNPLLAAIVSSQLDADRMDYLLRDAYETGTSYGNFDLERILRTLRSRNGVLCVKKSGMHSVEDYIMARAHMYYQVYLHPDAAAWELLVDRFFQQYSRVRTWEKNPLIEPLYHSFGITEFLDMDEARMFTAFQLARNSQDPVLADLAGRILDRRLFASLENPTEEAAASIKARMQELGYDPDVYFCETVDSSQMYRPYSEHGSPIMILEEDGQLRELSCHSPIVKALESMETCVTRRIFFPKEMLHA